MFEQARVHTPVGAPISTIRAARRIHLVGMAGSGMSSLARLLLDMGKQVSGCDLSPSEVLDALQASGAHVCIGHAPGHLGDVDLVVISSAISSDNPEVESAASSGIRVIKHAQALGELMHKRLGIAVAGTHGKSTTTALTAYLLHRAGLDPTLVGGAESLDFGASSRVGASELVVVEADEYDHRFLHLEPRVAIVTSVEPDHLDYFGSFENVVEAFRGFVRLLPAQGAAILCQDDPQVRGLQPACRCMTYGFDAGADYRIEAYRVHPREPAGFELRTPDGSSRAFELSLIGRHNASNAAAALIAARVCGAPWDTLQLALPGFRGTRRRFERIGDERGVTVVDDYAHHPTAVRVTLDGARRWWNGPVWVAFQPHTTHRTAALLDDFAAALDLADHVVLLPIYQPTGREYAQREVTSADVASRMQRPATLVGSLQEAAEVLANAAAPGALVITMGAGDVTRVGPMVLAALREHAA